MASDLEAEKKIKGTITFYDEEYIDSYDEPIILEFELYNGSSAFDKGELIGTYKVVFYNENISLVE